MVLKIHEGKITPEGLGSVLKESEADTCNYYHECIRTLDHAGLEVLATLLQQKSASDPLNLRQSTLVEKLVETDSKFQKATKQFFKDTYPQRPPR